MSDVGWERQVNLVEARMATRKGTKGKDKLNGTNGDDTILGKGGNDRLKGKDGDDHIKGGGGNDKIYGGDGDDDLFGGGGNDKMFGDIGNDFLDGGKGNDKLDGGADNDELMGGAGNDQLTGGEGDDIMDGGAGADTFFFHNLSSGRDDIYNFEVGIDKIVIDASSYGVEGMSVQDFISLYVSSSGGDSAIDLSGNGDDRPRVVLHGVDNGFDLENSIILA